MENLYFAKKRKSFGLLNKQADPLFQGIILLCVVLIVILAAGILLTLLIHSFPSLKAFGLSFLFNTTWDPVKDSYSALPLLAGTLLTSLLAIVICMPFSLSVSIFIGEYLKEGYICALFRNTTELLAGIPSIIYGFWALFVLVPLVRKIQIRFGALPYGVGIFTASIILSLMIIPYAASMGSQAISLVPSPIKEAAYSLGATRQEIITKIILPYARSGIISGILLALGRAIGETMAVTMVIGNANIMPQSLFSPGNSMASIIANEFTEATGKLHISALIEIGLILFLVTLVINISGKFIIKKMSIEP